MFFFLVQTENLYNFTFLNPLLVSTFTMFMLFLFVCFYIFYNSPVNTEITIDTQNLYLYCCCFCYCYLLNSTMIFDLFWQIFYHPVITVVAYFCSKVSCKCRRWREEAGAQGATRTQSPFHVEFILLHSILLQGVSRLLDHWNSIRIRQRRVQKEQH